jgi:hypothetical protein
MGRLSPVGIIYKDHLHCKSIIHEEQLANSKLGLQSPY